MKIFVWIIAAAIASFLTACNSCSGLKKTIADAECADGNVEFCDESETKHADPDSTTQAELSFTNSGFINKAESQAYLIKGLCTEAGQSVALSGDAFGYAPCDGQEFTLSYDFRGTPDGKVLIIGKHAGVEARVNLIKDAAPPLLAFSRSEAINAASAASYRLKGTCSDDGMPLVVDGAASGTSSCKSGFFEVDVDLRASADGPLSFVAQHTDQAGNIASTSPFTVTKDTALAAPSLLSAPSALVSSPHYSITVANSETVLYQYALVSIVSTCAAASYNGSWTSASTPISGSLPAQGSYRLCILIQDVAGNNLLPAEAASMVWQYSSTLPTVSISSTAAIVPANVGAYALTGSCSENGRTVTIGGAIVASTTCSGGAYSININFTALTDGTISFTADHSDANGQAAVQASASLSKVTSTAAAPNPTGLTASADSASAVTLTWTSGGGTTTGYSIAYQSGATAPADCASGTTVAPAAISGSSHQITGLTHETLYGFRVCALNAPAVPTSGVTASATTPSQAAPGNPSNLIASVNSTTAITLSWTSGGGTTAGYRIAYQSGATAPADCSSGTTLASNAIIGTSHPISSLTAGTQYAFRVCSINANSTPSVSAGVSSSASTQSAATLAEPTGLGASVDSSSAITLSWTAGGGSTAGYRIAYQSGATAPADCASGTTISETAISGVTHQISGLSLSTLYSFRLCSINGNATPDVSSGITVSATTQGYAAPNDPSGLGATVNSSSAITLAWTSGGGTTTAYRIAYQAGTTAPATCALGTTISEGSITGTSHQVTTLTYESPYSFRVCAINSNATPDVSAGITATATTQGLAAPADPTGLSATVVSSSAITLNWTSGGGTTSGYRIAYQTGASAPTNCSTGTTIAASAISGTSHPITGLSSSTLYSFLVCAINANSVPLVSTGVATSATTSSNAVAAAPNPSGFTAVAASNAAINLSWTTGGGTTSGFRIAYAAGASTPVSCSSDTQIDESLVTGTSHQITGLSATQNYSFLVCATNGTSYSSGVAASATTKTLATPPDATGLSAESLSPTRIVLKWTGGAGTTVAYKIAYQSGATAPASCSLGTVASVANDGFHEVSTSILPATQYSFRLCALNNDTSPTASAGITTSVTTLTSTGYRYWRIVINSVAGNVGFATVQDIKFYFDNSWQTNGSSGNLMGSLSMVSSASSVFTGSSASRAFDGTTILSWKTNALFATTGSYDELTADSVWVKAAFTSVPVDLQGIELKCPANTSGPPDAYKVQYSADNSAWTTKNTITGNCFGTKITYFNTLLGVSSITLTQGDGTVGISYPNPVGANDVGYLVVRGTSPVVFTPVDGTSYSAGTVGSDDVIYAGSSLSTVDSTVSVNSLYYYAVWSYDASQNYSAKTVAYIKTGPPSPLTLTATSGSSIGLSWTSGGAAATSYLVARSQAAIPTFIPQSGVSYAIGSYTGGDVVYVGTSLSTSDSSMNQNTWYYYKVWALSNGTYSQTGVSTYTSSIDCSTGFSFAGACVYAGATATNCIDTCTGLSRTFDPIGFQTQVYPNCTALSASVGVRTSDTGSSSGSGSDLYCGSDSSYMYFATAGGLNTGSKSQAGYQPICACK